MSSIRYVLAVDPGKTTGIAVLELDNRGSMSNATVRLVSASERQPDEFAEPVRSTLGWAHEHALTLDIVCERFIINAGTVRNSQAPFSLEQIGVLKQLLRDYHIDPDRDLYLQSPSDAKKMFPNDALRKIGTWHVGGGGHANDAIRHGLLWFTRKGWAPRALLK